MALGNQPNDVYLVEGLLQEFKQIRTENEYWTDVNYVEMPSYPPTADYKSRWLGVTAPALLMWVSRSAPSRGSNMNPPDRDLEVVVAGIVRGDRGLQQSVMRLGDDLRAVMLFNSGRARPGGSAMDGVTTDELPEGIDYAMDKDDGGHVVGYFFSVWALTHRFPRPVG
jgi:hypothetical protein